MKYSKILVAIDSTEEAENVIMSAMLVAEEHAEVHLINVVQPLAGIYGTMIWSPDLPDNQGIEDSLVQQSRSHLSELGLRHGLSIENIHTVIGSAAPKIRSLAEEIGADLIVIGTHGRHGIGLILGSTANAVLHGVNTDVLVIRLPSDG